MIKLHKYFYEETDFDINDNIQGESQRSRTGKIFTDISSDNFKEFELTIENLNPKEHGNLIYIVNLVLPVDGIGQDIDFVSPYGKEYKVTIPIDGFDYSPRRGKKERYDWQLTLWEVI